MPFRISDHASELASRAVSQEIAMHLAEEDAGRTGREEFRIELESTDIREMAEKLTPIPRHLISDGYDAALNAIAEVFPITIHEYFSGTPVFTWTVPERWICRRASLETMSGETVFSTDDSPLHAVSFSLPFDGVVTRDELMHHLYSPEETAAAAHPDAVQYIFKYYDRDWGLCCSDRQRRSLTDDQYRVKIDSDFSYGSLKVGEAYIEGQSRECVVLCAHLCHPGQFNDGLSGVIAGVKIMERLRERTSLRYSYRLLIVPETLGSICWLAHNEREIPLMRGGIFLEMMASRSPMTLMNSNTPDSDFDRAARIAVRQAEPDSNVVPFLKAYLNDERQFNAPGVKVPMVSLQRIVPIGDPASPYPEYHTSADTPDVMSFDMMERSIDTAIRVIDTFEADCIPVPLFKGELFVSGVDGLVYSTMGAAIRELTYNMDGIRKLSEIAEAHGSDIYAMRKVLDILLRSGLVELR